MGGAQLTATQAALSGNLQQMIRHLLAIAYHLRHYLHSTLDHS